MISHSDIDFHLPDDGDPTWAETNWFAFSIPEAKLMGIVYVLNRKTLGCMSVEVSITGAMCETRSELLYIDSRHHLPVVDKLSDFTTTHGLSIRAHSPKDYSISYTGYDDFSLQFDFEGLHEPWDIHNPEQNPLAKGDKHGGMGSAFGGHFEVMGHTTGSMTLRGQTYPIDCIETMDHSWGSRPEIFMPQVGWSHAHFSRDFALTWLNTFDIDAPVDEQQKLYYGYVLDQGETYGCTAGTFLTHRVGSLITGLEVSLTDVRGNIYHLRGISEVAMPMLCSSPSVLSTANVRWTLDDGRVGHGLATDFYSLQELSRRHGRQWKDLAARVTT